MTSTGCVDINMMKARRHSDHHRRSIHMMAPKQHYVRRGSSMKIKDHSSKSDITDIVRVAQNVSSMDSGVESTCKICALDLR
jgi:hypothetical protein